MRLHRLPRGVGARGARHRPRHVTASGSAQPARRGRDGAFVGGYGAEYDQVTPIQFAPDGIVLAEEPRRLVLPDDTEIRNVRYTCRGPDLHAIIGTVWYRSSVDNLSAGPAHPAT